MCLTPPPRIERSSPKILTKRPLPHGSSNSLDENWKRNFEELYSKIEDDIEMDAEQRPIGHPPDGRKHLRLGQSGDQARTSTLDTAHRSNSGQRSHIREGSSLPGIPTMSRCMAGRFRPTSSYPLPGRRPLPNSCWITRPLTPNGYQRWGLANFDRLRIIATKAEDVKIDGLKSLWEPFLAVEKMALGSSYSK